MHNSWHSSTNKIAIHEWSNEQEANFWSNNGQAMALSGYTNNSEEALMQKLFNVSESNEHSQIVSNTGGLYSLIYANNNQNRMQGWNTITRVEPLYYAENNQYIFISNRALLVHLMAINDLKPQYELKHFGAFLNTGFFNNEHTPYQGVSVVPPNSTIIASESGIDIRSLNKFEDETDLNVINEQFYDELVEVLIESFKPIEKHPIKLESGLTGGKDSRIITAVLKHMNANFKSYTSGFEEHPDVIVARKIALKLNIEHSVHTPKTSSNVQSSVTQDILGKTKDVLFSTDGMLSGYENVPKNQLFNEQKIILGGHGGEHLRGGYNRFVTKHNEEGVHKLFNQILNPFESLINLDIEQTYLSHLQNWESLKANEDPVDVLAKYFVYYRSGRWSSVARSGYTHNNYVYQPFFESNLNKMLLKIPARSLINEEVIYNIVKRLAPDLLDIPFAADRWKFEAKGPVDGNDKRWKERAPITAAKNSKGSFNWRRTTLTDLKSAMAEEIFSKKSERLFDIVNKDEVELLFTTDKYSSNREIDMFTWNLYSTSVLLSNKWLDKSHQEKIVETDLPPTKVGNTNRINFSKSNLVSNSKGLKVKSKTNKLTIGYGSSKSLGTNLYVHTFGGSFTSPPDKNLIKDSSLNDFKECLVEFKGKSTKEAQKIAVFFMCYDDKERIYNQSSICNLNKKQQNFSIPFKPPKKHALTFKIAIKVFKHEGSKEKFSIEDLAVKSLI